VKEAKTSASRPIQEPITGEEDLGDLTRPEEALAQFYRALNSRDLALLEQNWDTSYEAAMDNPLGGIMRGSPLVAPEHRHIFRAFVRRAFDGHGNSVDKTLRPFFNKPQLCRLATDNGLSLHCPPSALTVHQWASVFDAMMSMAPRNHWSPSRRHAKRESWRR
jgi:hypothetical protein